MHNVYIYKHIVCIYIYRVYNAYLLVVHVVGGSPFWRQVEGKGEWVEADEDWITEPGLGNRVDRVNPAAASLMEGLTAWILPSPNQRETIFGND